MAAKRATLPSEARLLDALKFIQKRIDSVSLNGISWAYAIDLLIMIRTTAEAAIKQANAEERQPPRDIQEVLDELDKEEAAHLVTIDDRDAAQDALQRTHIALGGDGEWVTRLPEPEPPESGDLRKDVPVIAAQIMQEAMDAQQRAETAEAALAERQQELAELKKTNLQLFHGIQEANAQQADAQAKLALSELELRQAQERIAAPKMMWGWDIEEIKSAMRQFQSNHPGKLPSEIEKSAQERIKEPEGK